MSNVTTKESVKVSLPFFGLSMTLVALLVTAGMCPRVSDIQLTTDAKAEHVVMEARAGKAHADILKRVDANQKEIIDLLKKRRR